MLMEFVTIPPELRRSSSPRWLQIRRSALQMCYQPEWSEWSPLGELSVREWRVLLRWLDISGLALYFFESICNSGLNCILPRAVLDRLNRSLAENKQRTSSMVADLAEIAS